MKNSPGGLPHISHWINALRGYDQLGNEVSDYKLQIADRGGKLHGNQSIGVDPGFRDVPSHKYLYSKDLPINEQKIFDDIVNLQRKNEKNILALEKKELGGPGNFGPSEKMEKLFTIKQTLANQRKPFDAKQSSADALWHRARSIHYEIKQQAILNAELDLSKEERFQRLYARAILLSHLYASKDYTEDRQELIVAALGEEMANSVLGITLAEDLGPLYDSGRGAGAIHQGQESEDRPDEGSPSDTVTMESAAYKKAVQAKIDKAREVFRKEKREARKFSEVAQTEGLKIHEQRIAREFALRRAGAGGSQVREETEKYFASLPDKQYRELFGRDPLIWTLKLYPRKYKTTPWFVGDQLLEVLKNLIQNTPKEQRSAWMNEKAIELEQNLPNAMLRDSYHMSALGKASGGTNFAEQRKDRKGLSNQQINDHNDSFLIKAYEDINSIYKLGEGNLTLEQLELVGEAHEEVNKNTDSPQATAEFLSHLKKAGRKNITAPFKYLSRGAWRHLVSLIAEEAGEYFGIGDIDTINFSQNKKILNWSGEESTEFQEIISGRRTSIIIPKTHLNARPVLGAKGGQQRTLADETSDKDFSGGALPPTAYKIKPQKDETPGEAGLPLEDLIKIGGVFRIYGGRESANYDIVNVRRLHPDDDLQRVAERNSSSSKAFIENIESGWNSGETFYEIQILPTKERARGLRGQVQEGPPLSQMMEKASVKPVSEAQSKPKGKPLKIGKRGEKSSRLGLPGMGREGYFHYPLKQGNKNIGDVILRKGPIGWTAAGNLDQTWDLLFLKLDPEYQGTGLGMQWLESEIDKALNKGISPTLQKVQSKKIQEWAKKKGGIFSKIKKDGEVGQILFKATKEPKKKVGWRGLTSEEMDEAVGNVETAKVDISSSTRKSPYFQKDLKKFKDATKLISRGSGKSSSAAYADAAGAKANTGEYDSSDVVGISVEGARKNRIGPDYDEIQLAIDAGVTFITDNPGDRTRNYNVGEREIAAFLTENGYEETSPGKWSPK